MRYYLSINFTGLILLPNPGEFSVRGGILDVFSFSHNEPYRIEFFGDEIDSIRTFDVETQLSTDRIRKITIIPNVENKLLEESRQNFLDYISSKTIVFTQDIALASGRMDSLFIKAEEAFTKLSSEVKHNTPEELFCNGENLQKSILNFSVVEVSSEAIVAERHYNIICSPNHHSINTLIY